jgi:hypothetical protein
MATAKKAVLIPFDESKPVEVIDLAAGLDAIYDRVAPDSRCFTGLGGSDFYLMGDDEGLFHQDAANRVNARVMQLYAEDNGGGISDFRSPLVGDWLVVGPADEEGETTDVPQRVIDFEYSWTAVRPGA